MTEKLDIYVRRGNRRVEGWLSDGAIQLVRRIGDAQIEAGIRGHVAEIGIFQGRLFILLALLARPEEKAVAIDLFGHHGPEPDGPSAGNLARFRENLTRHTDPTAVVIHAGDSTRVTGQDVMGLAGGSVRLFSIDGGHSAETTLHDLETAESALASGGVIILDDCFNERWPDVSTGVHRFFSTSRRVVPFATGGNKTFLTTPDCVDGYKAAIRNCGTEKSEREFIGYHIYSFGFERPSLEEWVGRLGLWRTVKDVPGIRHLRSFYRAHRLFFRS